MLIPRNICIHITAFISSFLKDNKYINKHRSSQTGKLNGRLQEEHQNIALKEECFTVENRVKVKGVKQ